jgi:hypothetical protein
LPILEDFEPLPRYAYAIYPSNRFIPAKVRALTDIIAIEHSNDGRERAPRSVLSERVAVSVGLSMA